MEDFDGSPELFMKSKLQVSAGTTALTKRF